MTYLYPKHKSDFYFVSHSDRQLKSQSCLLKSKVLRGNVLSPMNLYEFLLTFLLVCTYVCIYIYIYIFF